MRPISITQLSISHRLKHFRHRFHASAQYVYRSCSAVFETLTARKTNINPIAKVIRQSVATTADGIGLAHSEKELPDAPCLSTALRGSGEPSFGSSKTSMTRSASIRPTHRRLPFNLRRPHRPTHCAAGAALNGTWRLTSCQFHRPISRACRRKTN